MNYNFWPALTPIKVLIVNPLLTSSQMVAVKISSGVVFGTKQSVDMTFLVYSNEIPTAEGFIQELKGCNYGCLNSIVATSNLPSITDADVFCFMTNFPNPNWLDFEKFDTEEQFDTFYLITKVAHSLNKSQLSMDNSNNLKNTKPLIVADGLVVLDILNIMIKNISPNCLCPTGTSAVAKTVLSEKLKVKCNEINHIYVWGANDTEFYVEVQKPYVLYDINNQEEDCGTDIVSKELLDPLNLDQTRFNASWMKKEYIKKLKHICAENPYGNIYKAWQITDVLSAVWKARSSTKIFKPLGIISDGSLETIKGLPYILPVLVSEDSWKVDERFKESPHVKQEIKRFNIIARKHHEKLVRYCNKFLMENVINQAFVTADEESITTFSSSFEESVRTATMSNDVK